MSGLLIGPGCGVSNDYPASPTGHVVNAIRFNRGDTYTNRGAALTGAVDGDQFLCSFWFNKKGADGTFSTAFGSLNQDFIIRQPVANTWDCRAKKNDTTSALSVTSTTQFSTILNTGWHHLIISGDLSAGDPRVRMFLDDVQEVNVVPGVAEINFDSAEWEVGRDPAAAGNGFDGEIAELFFDTKFLDLSVVANRRKFSTAANKPRDLGATGEIPFGSDPLIFFTGATVDWQTNKGTGGGFTENGTLVTATSFPSDV